jgi:hypothetical protein
MFGLETLTTRTSAYGLNVFTPVKSSGDSTGEDLLGLRAAVVSSFGS